VNGEALLGRDDALRVLANIPGEDTRDFWSCRVAFLVLRLPNFRWRRRAIAAHDLHHLMTGFPMTMRGEFQLAAWEWAAGRYTHWGATLFCSPLIVAGFLWSPRRMIKAFRLGQQAMSLYPALAHHMISGDPNG